MPSFTFVSTAAAVVLRGAVPVFVDIREDTLNLDERLLEDAITARTRAVCPVHYAGVCAEMDPIMDLARRYGLWVVEDAAQALGSSYRGRPAGSLGDLACFSFHETKNFTSGEGGALITARPELAARAAIIRDKGTNRRLFLDGEVDKYTWVDVGSSFAPSEFISAVLWAQLEASERVTRRRLELWTRYDEAFAALEAAGRLHRPKIPAHCAHNGHLYYLLLEDEADRDRFIRHMRAQGVAAPFHYVPLHASPAGARHGRCHGRLKRTEDLAARLVRLPLHLGLGDDQETVIAAALDYASGRRRRSRAAAALAPCGSLGEDRRAARVAPVAAGASAAGLNAAWPADSAHSPPPLAGPA